jgi:hypothetical protein
MYKKKSTRHVGSISVTPAELKDMQCGVLHGFEVHHKGIYQRLVSAEEVLKGAVRIPITDKDGEFKTMSCYYVAKYLTVADIAKQELRQIRKIIIRKAA